MKVAHVVIGGEVAGGQIVALRLARAAREAGHDVVVVSPSGGPFLDLVRDAGIRAYVMPVSGALDVVAIVRLVRFLRAQRIDLVHTHGHFGVNVVARVAARVGRVRVLSHMHVENAFRAGLGRTTQVALDNATARLCFAIVAVSDATRVALVRQGYPVEKLVTVRNGIDAAPIASPTRLADGPVVLEVARLAEVKGQRTLIAAIAELDAAAVLVGLDLERGGAYEEELRREALRLGVPDRVIFAGYRADVAALLAGCDVFCLPSHAEGLPMVVLEAMMQARPVVATPAGGTAELVVDGETGLLVPAGDAEALAAALRTLLDDPGRARRFGEAGRARVLTEFSADRVAERILGLYGTAA